MMESSSRLLGLQAPKHRRPCTRTDLAGDQQGRGDSETAWLELGVDTISMKVVTRTVHRNTPSSYVLMVQSQCSPQARDWDGLPARSKP